MEGKLERPSVASAFRGVWESVARQEPAAVLKDKLFVSYGKSEIYRLLAELGYTLQRPKWRYIDGDLEKAAHSEKELVEKS